MVEIKKSQQKYLDEVERLKNVKIEAEKEYNVLQSLSQKTLARKEGGRGEPYRYFVVSVSEELNSITLRRTDADTNEEILKTLHWGKKRLVPVL